MCDKTTVEKIVEKLQNSPLFHFSLGSKELFHSNFIAWIASISADGQPFLGKKLFKSVFSELGIDTSGWDDDFEVLREKQNLDLAVCRPGDREGKSGYLLVVENKLKSIPSLEQIERYTTEKNGVTANTHKVLLTLMSDFPDSEGILNEGWGIITYSQLSSAIAKLIPDVKESPYIASIFEDYCGFIEAIDVLARHYKTDDESPYFISAADKSELEDLRIYDMIDKVRMAQFASTIKSALPDGFEVRTGYGHGNAFVEIWRVNNDGKPDAMIAIQGDHYSHGIYPCDGLEWDECMSLYPGFLEKDITEFQHCRLENDSQSVFTDMKIGSKLPYGKFKADNDGELRYQYVKISKDATFAGLMEAIESDIKTLLKVIF